MLLLLSPSLKVMIVIILSLLRSIFTRDFEFCGAVAATLGYHSQSFLYLGTYYLSHLQHSTYSNHSRQKYEPLAIVEQKGKLGNGIYGMS